MAGALSARSQAIIRLNSILLSGAPRRDEAPPFLVVDTLGEIRRRKSVMLICLDNASTRPARSTEERLGDGGRKPRGGGHLRETPARPRDPARDASGFPPQGSRPLANLDLG